MALKQNTTLACSYRQDTLLNLANYESEKYPDFSTSVKNDLDFGHIIG